MFKSYIIHLSSLISLTILLFDSVDLKANKLLIEKTLKASFTESVPSAESFLPVNGRISGPL